MAEKRSIYLSTQALGMPRRRDSLSGRINQVCSRYAELISAIGPPVRARFSAAEWSALLDACAAWPEFDALSPLDRLPAGSLCDRVRALSTAERCALAEMIEAEL